MLLIPPGVEVEVKVGVVVVAGVGFGGGGRGREDGYLPGGDAIGMCPGAGGGFNISK